LIAAGLSACSSVPGLDSRDYTGFPTRVELEQVPYYADDPYQCGPQSLAMLLTASGVPTQPTTLVEDVYVPGKQGSFAPELRAAARARGRLPYQLEPSTSALVTALADGYPVLILQNVGLGFAPTWHFAVVVGYDRERDLFLLRSGPHERQEMDTIRFERRWRLGEYWGIALLGPEQLPGWIRLGEYEQQLAYLEAPWGPELEAVYRRMQQRWPQSTTANLGLGNFAFSRGELDAAEHYYRTALASDGDHIAALNNLAEVYARRHQPGAAFKLACRALRLAEGHPLEATVTATVEALQRESPERGCPDPYAP
jgi:tetratricopeptide (TPR) repeat protein